MNRNTKRIVALGTPIAAVAVTGIAFAAWTASGTGSGAATATHEVVTVSSATAPTADLFPNGDAGALVVSVTNPNSGPIEVTSIVKDPAATTDALGQQGLGCTTGYPALSLNASTITSYLAGLTDAAKTIAGHGGNTSFTIPGGVSMGGTSDNSCQDASLTYPVKVTAVTP